ncbi:MAG TPA: protein phosphatase 2C domain-containing protein [Stellaceae bacterium]|nr:protein phosphatase 2C domain-containing protein [Stellaceae bacterium]
MTERGVAAEVKFVGGFSSSAVTDAGAVRDHNEDSYISCPDIGLWAVADGVGGHYAGDVASRTATEALRTVPAGLNATHLITEVRMRLAMVHRQLKEEAAQRGVDAMASTIVVLLARGSYFACLWAGDSRVYLLRDGKITQLTRDHSLVQELVDAKTITEDEATTHPRSNVITRAVGGGDAELALDKYSAQLCAGDRFLLCSDGLWKTLAPEELARVLLTADGKPSAERLLEAALERRADDNVTIITVEVSPEFVPSGDHGDESAL